MSDIFDEVNEILQKQWPDEVEADDGDAARQRLRDALDNDDPFDLGDLYALAQHVMREKEQKRVKQFIGYKIAQGDLPPGQEIQDIHKFPMRGNAVIWIVMASLPINAQFGAVSMIVVFEFEGHMVLLKREGAS